MPLKNSELCSSIWQSCGELRSGMQRLADEGVVEKQKHPAGFIVKHPSLFE
jgi:DNA processing protein